MHIKNTLFIGKVFLDFPQLDSTNAYAAELLSKTAPAEGTVISTFHQYAGKGQLGSAWESEPLQNLSFSVVLYPQWLTAAKQFALNTCVSLALRDFIARYAEKTVKIKWPNDIYVQNRKIAGILIQNTLSGQTLQASIVGMGVNVNQTFFSAQAPHATSLALETMRVFDLYELLSTLCQALEQRYLQLKNSKDPHFLLAEYTQHLFGLGDVRHFRRQNGAEVFAARISHVEPTGRLVVQHAEGTTEAFATKELVFLGDGVMG